MAARLDADLALVLKLLPPIVIETTTPKSFRELLRGLAAASGAFPLPTVRSTEDITVKGAVGALKARVYRPTAEVAPTVVFFHGGGCVGGDIETHDRSARRLAIETGAIVISVDYRLAPETRFPGAFDDALAAVHDVATRIDEFGRNAQRIGLAGDGAGGGLAAATAIACRDRDLTVAAQLLIYPGTDMGGLYASAQENSRFPSRTENADGYFTTLALMRWCADCYLPDKRSSFDWRASPLRARSLTGVAPAVVCTAEFDPLRDEGEAYADALLAAGVATYRRHGPGMIRGYFEMGDSWPAARAEAARVRLDFKSLLNRKSLAQEVTNAV
jgi:acetyl esterase